MGKKQINDLKHLACVTAQNHPVKNWIMKYTILWPYDFAVALLDFSQILVCVCARGVHCLCKQQFEFFTANIQVRLMCRTSLW